MKLKFLQAAIVSLMLSVCHTASAGLIGVDLNSDASQWTNQNANGWTLGYKFNTLIETEISGLGFWDLDGVFGESTVTLWDSIGSVIGTLSTGGNTVESVATLNGHGSWYFMSLAQNINLVIGTYTVGSYGTTGREATWATNTDVGTLAIDSTIEYLSTAEFNGNTYPATNLTANSGYFGGNIMIADTQDVPEPSTLVIFALGIMVLTARYFKKI